MKKFAGMKALLNSIYAADDANALSSLSPVRPERVQAISSDHHGISGQYLDFLLRFGTGSTTDGFSIYEPVPVSEIQSHPSFQIYNSDTSSRLFGVRTSPKLPPDDAVMIADTGASWRYCLCPSKGEAVFCLEMFDPEFTLQAESFYAFVLRDILDRG